MPNLYGATDSRTSKGKPGSNSLDVPVLVDSHGRVITVPGPFAQSPSGLVRPRAENDGTLVVTEKRGLVVTQWQEVPGITAANALDANDAMGSKGRTTHDIYGRLLPVTGVIIGAKLLDRDDDTLSATIHIYNDDFTAAASDDAFTISAADSIKWITNIPFPVTTDDGAIKVSEVADWDAGYYAPNGFYWQFSTAGTPTIAAGLSPMVQLYILPLDRPS